MCTKPFSQTKNKGKLFLVAKSSGPLLARMPLNTSFKDPKNPVSSSCKTFEMEKILLRRKSNTNSWNWSFVDAHMANGDSKEGTLVSEINVRSWTSTLWTRRTAHSSFRFRYLHSLEKSGMHGRKVISYLPLSPFRFLDRKRTAVLWLLLHLLDS